MLCGMFQIIQNFLYVAVAIQDIKSNSHKYLKKKKKKRNVAYVVKVSARLPWWFYHRTTGAFLHAHFLLWK